jgi:Fe-S cluster assembly protein SufD
MNTQLAQRQQAQRQWFNDIVARNSAELPADSQPWLNEVREHATQAIGSIALPDRKQEQWRYSNLDSLYKNTYQSGQVQPGELDQSAVTNWIYSEHESHRLVIANGRYVPELSSTHALPDGVIIGGLHQMLASEPGRVARLLGQGAWRTADIFSELNTALIDDGIFIQVAANCAVDKPVEVVYLNISADQNALSQPRTMLILEAGSQASIIERFTGKDAADYFFNGVTEVSLGENARLQHYRLQNESSHAHHLSRIALRQDTASQYHGFNIANGGAWSRTDICARFDGPHASCDLDGLYTVGERQYTDFHLDIVHSQPHCSSREDFRGIVFGQGRAVFDGRILVEKDAQKTDARLTNKNLMLSQLAEIDTKPQLEIHADDVKCSHGTTVGRLDPNQLFYLRSRGIDEHIARRMICLGFAEQVLTHVDDEKVHDYIHDSIAGIFGSRELLP